MAATTIEASDSRALHAVAKAAATTPTQRGALAADMLAYSAAIAQGKTKDEAVEAVIALRMARERATSGRSLSEPVNVLDEVVVTFLTAAEDVTPAWLTAAGAAGGSLGGAPGAVAGAAVGKGAGEVVKDVEKAVNGVLKYVLTVPSVADYVNGVRARSGAEAAAEFAKDAGLLDDAVEMAWSAARKDPESAEAFRVLFADLAGAPDDQAFTATAGEVIDNHPELFDVTYVTVQADNSVVISEIDEARSDILAKLDEFSTDVDGRLAQVSEGLADLQRRQDELADGQAGLRSLIEKAQAGAQKRAEAEQAARAQAAFVQKLYDDAQGTVTGIAALATLVGDPKLGSDIAKFGGTLTTHSPAEPPAG